MDIPQHQRPLELIFVRHGESEGNVATNAAEKGDFSHFTEEFKQRHSSSWNLTEKGIEQAKAAGEWIRQNINGGVFDAYYTSTYRRARRTAGFLNLPDAHWYIRDYIREHDWGNLDAMTDTERRQKYPEVMQKKDIHPYYFAAPGGESIADVAIRARVGILATVFKDLPGKRGIIVSHGNMMWPIRIIMERLLPEEYQEVREDKTQKISNCQVIQYSRIHPVTGEITDWFSWTRSICPWNLNPETDIWRPLKRKRYTNEELVNA